MLKSIMLGAFLCVCATSTVNAEEDPGDTYLYKSVCPDPAGGAMQVDKWSFYKCECTSYVAFKLNESGISFNNQYKGVHWGYASNWKSAAEHAGISTGNIPHVGDAAWWSGHIAYVEKVDYDLEGNWSRVYISEYNAVPAYGHEYSDTRDFAPSTDGRPQAYIHFKNHPPKKEQLKVSSFPGADHIAWYPQNKTCNEAERWFELKDNGEVKEETDQQLACSVVEQKVQEEVQRILQAQQQAAEEAYLQALEARRNHSWWKRMADFVRNIFHADRAVASDEIGEELNNLVAYRTITFYVDDSGDIVDQGVGIRSGGDYQSGIYSDYTNNGTGAVERSQPGESDHEGYVHNISMDDVEITIAGEDDYHHSLTFYNGQVPKVHIRARLKNKTNHEVGANDVTIKWFEFPNETLNPDHDHHFATDHNKYSLGPFEHNSHDDELVEKKTGIKEV